MNHTEFMKKQEKLYRDRYESIISTMEDPKISEIIFKERFKKASILLIDAIILTTNNELETVTERLSDDENTKNGEYVRGNELLQPIKQMSKNIVKRTKNSEES